MTTRAIANGLAMVIIFVASVLPKSWFADGLRYLGAGCIAVLLASRARTGYLRRRPYWTAQSWRRFLAACSIPIAALLIVAGMVAALEWRLPIVGAANSPARSAWAVATLVFMLIGAGGLAVAIEWLADGEPSRQFSLRR